MSSAPPLPSADPSAGRDPGRVRVFLELIRFSHTLFALPWALAGLFLGAGGWPEPRVLAWVILAMVGARTAAMSFNRLVDRRLDATNPRTASRPSVTGAVGSGAMTLAVLLASALFVFAAYRLNPLCGALSWPTLVILLGYSLCKRFTSLAHFVLGIALGLSPLGAYLAARGAFDGGSLAAGLMGAAVVTWTAGFDIFYACQDVGHDRAEGLHSVPARLGIPGALWVARLSHATIPFFLLGAHVAIGGGPIFLGGVVIVTALLVWEHRLVRADDLSRVGVAFFQMNVAIAVVMMLATLLDRLGAAGALS